MALVMRSHERQNKTSVMVDGFEMASHAIFLSFGVFPQHPEPPRWSEIHFGARQPPLRPIAPPADHALRNSQIGKNFAGLRPYMLFNYEGVRFGSRGDLHTEPPDGERFEACH